MEYGNLFVRVILSYYLIYIISLIFNKNRREQIKQHNKNLAVLRKKPIKTIKEQREFINLRYPKLIGRFKWSWMLIPRMLPKIAFFVSLIIGSRYLFEYFGIHIKIWQAILFMIIFPIIINLILERLKLEKGSNMAIFFRGWF